MSAGLFLVLSLLVKCTDGNIDLTSYPANTQNLILENLFLSFVETEELSYLTNLVYLSLTENQIHTFPDARPVDGLLAILLLSNNLISSVPVEYLGSAPLQRLHLDNNQLSEFPNLEPVKFTMQFLDLSKNQITYIPNDALLGFTQIQLLSLHNNQFTTLPNACDVSLWQYVDPLLADDADMITCDCESQHLYHVQSSLTTNLKCSQPSAMSGLLLQQNLSLSDLPCSDGLALGSRLKEMMMAKVKDDFYCGYPPVTQRTTVSSVSECASLCLDRPDCYYINTFKLESDDVICDVTGTSASQSALELALVDNSTGWQYYSMV